MHTTLTDRRHAEKALRAAGYFEAANTMRESADAIERGDWDGISDTLEQHSAGLMFAGTNGREVGEQGRRMYSLLAG